jgi:transcriptional regulator with XRE-family HTH domain
MTTPEQIRAARALVGLSHAEVAAMTGKTTKTIRRAETDVSDVAAETIAAIRAALEAAGVDFIAENGGGPGVRLRK